MAKTKKVQLVGATIEEKISATDLINYLLECTMGNTDNVYVTLRQTEGTDFPPFLSIETKEIGATYEENGQVSIW